MAEEAKVTAKNVVRINAHHPGLRVLNTQGSGLVTCADVRRLWLF